MYQNPDTKVVIPVSIKTPIGVDTDTNLSHGRGGNECQLSGSPARENESRAGALREARKPGGWGSVSFRNLRFTLEGSFSCQALANFTPKLPSFSGVSP